MTNAVLSLPVFHATEGLGAFLGDLRSWVFRSKNRAARHFGLAHTTIMRYENDQILCPLGYIAALAQLVIDQLDLPPYQRGLAEQQLLATIQFALNEYAIDFTPLATWQALQQLASAYLAEVQQQKQDQAKTGPLMGVLHDWGDAPDVQNFVGREDETATLVKWLQLDRCRLVAIIGLGGMGKTSLATRVAQQAQDDFKVLVWRSLQQGQQANDFLLECLHRIIPSPNSAYPAQFEQRLSVLIDYLRTTRCLLILDNIEAILQPNYPAGRYREGYEQYAQLFQAISERAHESCLIVTSREKPYEFNRLEGVHTRSMVLTGLIRDDAQMLLDNQELYGTPQLWQELIKHYTGNPLALKLVAQVIKTMFFGQIAEFLQHEELIFGDVRTILAQQFERLSDQEQELLYWLAIERHTVKLAELKHDLVRSKYQHMLLETLESLLRRSLVERHQDGFMLHNVVLEYTTDRLIDQIAQELLDGTQGLLYRHALIKANSLDSIREHQSRAILRPLLHRIFVELGQERLLTTLRQLLQTMQALSALEMGYAPGNIFNLLVELKADLSQFDFRHKPLWHANLRGLTPKHLDLSYSDLSRTVFSEQFGPLIALARDPADRFLAVATADDELIVWHSLELRKLWHLPSNHDGVRTLSFSSDGRFLISAGNDGIIRLWEASQGHNPRMFVGHTQPVIGVVVAPQSQRLISASSDGELRVWDRLSGKCLQTINAHSGGISSIQLSADGQLLATAGIDRQIKLWHGQHLRYQSTLTTHHEPIQLLAFSPDATILAGTGLDGDVYLWDLQDNQLITSLANEDRVFDLQFSPDGANLATAGIDQCIRVWQVQTVHLTHMLYGHQHWVRALRYSRDGSRLYSVSSDQSLRIWEQASGRLIHTLQGYRGGVRSLALSLNNDLLFSSSEAQAVALWQLTEPYYRLNLPPETNNGRELAYHQASHSLALSKEQLIQIWDCQRLQLTTILTGHHGLIRALSFRPDGSMLASCSEDHTVHIWSLPYGHISHVFDCHDDLVTTLEWSHNGNLLATGSADHTIRIWGVNEHSCVGLLAGHSASIIGLSFSPDQRQLVSAAADQQVRIWDLSTEQYEIIALHKPGLLKKVQWSADGRWIVITAGSLALIWDWQKRQIVQRFEHLAALDSAYLSADSHMLITGDQQGTITIWDLTTGKLRKRLHGDHPYQGLSIKQATGLNPAEQASLLNLGAVIK
ncbi:NB-ARC domain-containing protein [Herpetosiphon giganteus]|uniref:WD40 domain-containing protein n=1 Tax=Herpetosiphon giganteus TaxID=2029754 RepID=UPI00195EB78D|nr:NB-ARC domain-containing protein [Herpetosiphon giganteus]MBM7841852.1 WD40 repeat protein [Herpetosiphon giganteus]